MQRTIAEILAEPGPSFSFEFFPPQTDEGEAQLWRAIRDLEPLNPTFVDVTYGAGGSKRDRTLRVVERIVAETTLTVVAHLTCVGASREQLREVIRDLADAGVRNVLAIRGDPPTGLGTRWDPHPEGLTRAVELVELLHAEGDFCVGVAAHPEGHPESADAGSDLRHFVAKCAAGADFAVTNFFFDPKHYVRLVEAAAAEGCHTPIIPGVMPITNVAQIERMALMTGAAVPAELTERLHAVAAEPVMVRSIGVEVATELARDLLEAGAPGIHFYTLNRSTATREIYTQLHPGHA